MTSLFQKLINHAIQDELDAHGRPLGEQRTCQYNSLKTKLVNCPYPGSRLNHSNLMNITALKQITTNWNEILSIILCLYQNYKSKHNIVNLSYLDVWKISSMAMLLPVYLKEVCPEIEKIPIYAAGLYKTVFGLIHLSMKLAIDETFSAHVECSEEYMFNYAENSGEFIGVTEVCAGPVHLIKEVITLILTGGLSGKITIVSKSEFDFNFDNFFNFSEHACNFLFSFIIYLLSIRNDFFLFDANKSQKLLKDYSDFRIKMINGQTGGIVLLVSTIENMMEFKDINLFINRLKDFIYESVQNTYLVNLHERFLANQNSLYSYFEWEDIFLSIFSQSLLQAQIYTEKSETFRFTSAFIQESLGMTPLSFFYSF